MGIFQRYNKIDKDGNPVIGKNGKPKKEGPWFIQYPHSRDPQTGKIKYRTEKASFSKKKAENIYRAKVDVFQEMDKLGAQVDFEITFTELINWGLDQDIMKAKASSADDVTRGGHLKTAFQNCKAVQVTPLMVDNFRVRMKQTLSKKTKKPFSGSSVNKMVSLARRIYYLAMDAGIVNTNPFARRGIFKEEPKGKYIPDKEFWKICKHLPGYLQSVCVAAYLTGMRRGEIIGLTWNRVDLFGGYVNLTEGDTKTEDPRRIYFNSVKKLRDVLVEAARTKKSDQKLVFTKSDGSPVPKWYIERLFKKACNKANASPYRFHDLRHTFNTNMLKAGVDQTVIMKLTGHKTNKMFLRYSHIDREMGEAAMQKLNKYLSNAESSVESNHPKKEEQTR